MSDFTNEPGLPPYGSPEPGRPAMARRNPYRTGIVAVILVAIVGGLGGLGVVQYRQSVRNQGSLIQNTVMQDQSDVIVAIDKHLRASSIAAQTASEERRSATELIYKAVSGRYVDPNGNTTPAKAALGQGWAISSLREEYPQFSNDLFKQLIDVAVGTLDDMAGAQVDLQASIKDLRDFITTGSVFNRGVHREFPTEDLYFVDPYTHLRAETGKKAMDHFSVPITVKAAADASKSGQLDDPNLFGKPAPTNG